MSVLDQFREAEQRVAQRLKELEPAVAEYRQLEEVANRLGIDASASSAPSPSQGSGRRRVRRTSASSSRAASAATKPASRRRSRRGAATGQRQQQLLDLVRSRPGITVREAGTALGVDPTGLYRVVSRLEASGDLRKNGRQLEPAGTAT